MTKIEKKIFDWIGNNILLLFLGAVTVLGIVIRMCGINFQSGDYNSFLNPWWTQIKNAGLNGLGTQVGNYNIPYQIITYLFTLLPFGPLVSYKLLSIIFDIVLAGSAALLVNAFDKNKSHLKAVVTYSVVFCSLTVVFNSAFWAQCDSIYVSFILLAIYFLKKEKDIASFAMLGIALAFKLQMIFILPVFLFYYVCTRRVSILHFLIIPAADFIMCLPAIILGRNPLDLITIYAEQTDYGKLIQMNCPNIYAFMCDGSSIENYYQFKTLSIVLTVTILGAALCMLVYKRVDLKDSNNFMLAAIWSVFTCLIFLSSMHERYGYLLDILTIIYAVVTVKRVWFPVVCNLVSLRGYCFYLFKYDVLDIKLTAVVFVGVYAYVSYIFIKEVVLNGKKLEDKKPALTETQTEIGEESDFSEISTEDAEENDISEISQMSNEVLNTIE